MASWPLASHGKGGWNDPKWEEYFGLETPKAKKRGNETVIFEGENGDVKCTNLFITAKRTGRKLKWYKDGLPISGSDKKIIIKKAQQSDAGIYKCSVGHEEKSQRVTIKSEF